MGRCERRHVKDREWRRKRWDRRSCQDMVCAFWGRQKDEVLSGSRGQYLRVLEGRLAAQDVVDRKTRRGTWKR